MADKPKQFWLAVGLIPFVAVVYAYTGLDWMLLPMLIYPGCLYFIGAVALELAPRDVDFARKAHLMGWVAFGLAFVLGILISVIDLCIGPGCAWQSVTIQFVVYPALYWGAAIIPAAMQRFPEGHYRGKQIDRTGWILFGLFSLVVAAGFL